MKYLYASAFAAAGLAAAALSACSSLAKLDPDDTTNPTVTIKYRDSNNQYVTGPGISLVGSSTNSTDVLCTVNDQGGVSRISLVFTAKTGACHVGGFVLSGNYAIQKPPDQVQNFQPDANQMVPIERLFLATVKGPFTCSAGGNIGVLAGSTITATCTGKNWSNTASAKTASAQLTIGIQ